MSDVSLGIFRFSLSLSSLHAIRCFPAIDTIGPIFLAVVSILWNTFFLSLCGDLEFACSCPLRSTLLEVMWQRNKISLLYVFLLRVLRIRPSTMSHIRKNVRRWWSHGSECSCQGLWDVTWCTSVSMNKCYVGTCCVIIRKRWRQKLVTKRILFLFWR